MGYLVTSSTAVVWSAGGASPFRIFKARFHQNATSPSSEIHIQHFGGAIARVGEDETAQGERQAPFVLNAIATTHEPGGGLETHIDWAQRFYAEIEPSLTGGADIDRK